MPGKRGNRIGKPAARAARSSGGRQGSRTYPQRGKGGGASTSTPKPTRSATGRRKRSNYS